MDVISLTLPKASNVDNGWIRFYFPEYKIAIGEYGSRITSTEFSNGRVFMSTFCRQFIRKPASVL